MKGNGILAAFFAVFITVSATGMEIESVLAFGNVAFDPQDESSLGEAEEAFDPRLHGFGSLAVSDRLNETLDFRAGFERDPILRNTIFTLIGFTSDYTRLTFGPFFGPFNAEGSVLSAGISAGLRLELPGAAFATFRADSTIGAGLSSPGDNTQERSEITVGFWAPNAVVSLRLSSQTFTVREERALDIADERTRYELLADAFKKNVPYTASVNIGYQSLSRSYIGQLETAEDELRSVIVGFTLSVQASVKVRLAVGSEAALYSWGADDLGNPDSGTALFTARFGITIAVPDTGFSARNGETYAP